MFTQQSYCRDLGILIRSSSVCLLRCMDPSQILCEATYKPFLQTNFQIFTILFSISLNIEPHGCENVKTLLLPSLVFDRFQQNFMINMSVMGDIYYGITFFDELSKIFKFKEI